MPDATLVASYPAYGNEHVGRIRRSRRIRQWRGADAGCDACRVLSSLRERTCRADKAFTPHPPVAAVQMPDATLVASYPAYGNEHVGRIRRSRSIRRRGADAGCDACRVLSGLGNIHVGRIRRLRRIRQPLQIIA
ncbi:hypothetical protein P4909_00285 [Escherichia coli]